MSSGMSKKAPPSKGRKYQIELSSASVFFWSVCFLFFMGWIFVLGILVGRGFLPGANTAIADLKGQVAKLQEMVARNKRVDQKPQAKDDIDSKLGFYDRLESKKEDRKKAFPEVPREPSRNEKAAKPADGTLAEVKADIAKKDASAKKQEAARNAGIEKKGIEPGPETVPPVEKGPGAFRYVIQLAALDEKAKAEDLVSKLSQRGVEAYVQETVVKGKQYYRVRCGRFMSKEEATAYGSTLPKEAGKSWRVVSVE